MVTTYPSNRTSPVETRGGSRSVRRIIEEAKRGAQDSTDALNRAVLKEPDYSRPPKYDGGRPVGPETPRPNIRVGPGGHPYVVPEPIPGREAFGRLTRDASRQLARDLARAGRVVSNLPVGQVLDFIFPDPITDGGGEPTTRVSWQAFTQPGTAPSEPTIEEIEAHGWTVLGWTTHPCSGYYGSNEANVDWDNVPLLWESDIDSPGDAGGCYGVSSSPLSELQPADWVNPVFADSGGWKDWARHIQVQRGVINKGLNEGLYIGQTMRQVRVHRDDFVPMTDLPGSEPVTRYLPWPDIAPARGPARTGEPWNQPPGSPEPAPWRNPDARNPVHIPLMPVPVFGFPWPETDADPTPQPAEQMLVIDSSGTIGGRARRTFYRDRGRFGRNVRERKVRMSGAALGLWHIVNFVTETGDFLDALHDALPRRCRARSQSPYRKAEAVFRCFDHLDVAKAVENYVNNELSDYVWARIGRAGRHLNQATGAPTGGGRLVRGLTENVEPDVSLVPRIHFDPIIGEWSLDTMFGSIGGNVGGRVW